MAASGGIWSARLRAAWAVLLAATALPASAQITSQGRGSMTFMLGQGAGPTGGIAANVVAGANLAPDTSNHAAAFRIGGGYQFADHLAAEVALSHVGTLRSRAPFAGTDTLVAETQFDAVEADLVGRIPFAANFRVDLSAGAAITGLKTALRTEQGSAVPPQAGTLNARRAGLVAGADLEWRLGDTVSLLAGYHLYSRVGSSAIVGLASGTITVVAAGLRVEF